jgi:hypothetical protein
MPTASQPPVKRLPETVWRLVDAKCDQISEAASGTRFPLAFALTFSVIWLSALYVSELGYIHQYRSEVVRAAAVGRIPLIPSSPAPAATAPTTTAPSPAPTNSPRAPAALSTPRAAAPDKFQPPEAFKTLCLERVFGKMKDFTIFGDKHAYDEQWQLLHCRNVILQTYEFASRARFESTMVTLPWGMGRMHISDFGITANVTLILILIWLLFALRRENHAIKNFVDFHQAYRPVKLTYQDPFIVVATEPVLSPEHYAYAYHAVSQRFMFLFSVRRSPLFFASMALGAFPAVISLLNLLSNIRSLFAHSFEPAVYVRFAIEVGLVLLVIVITVGIMRFMLDTSVLLNGWGLAVHNVWLDAWDESTLEDAPGMVLVSIAGQTAQYTQDPFARKARPTADDPAPIAD